MKVAFYDGGARDNVPRVADIEWPELVSALTTHQRSSGCAATPCEDRKCPAKLSFPAWSPVDLAPCPPVCRTFAPAHTKPDGTFVPEKGCGGGRLHRLNDNVRAVTAAVFDLDHLTEEQLRALDLAGHGWVLYSTHSNKPGDVCLRLVMPISRPVLPAEWPAVRAAAVARFALPADPSVKDLSRIYFLPDAPPGTEAWHGSAEGPPLDVDALLESARAGLGARSTQAASEPLSDGAPTDVHELAALLKRHCKPENRALIGRVLRGEPVAPLGSQDTSLQALMSTCAFCLPNDTPDDALIHILRPSFAATDWKEGTEHLIGEALKKLHRARERKNARDAERLEKNRQKRAQLGMREPGTQPAAPMDEDAPEDPDAWTDQLITVEHRDKGGKVTSIGLKNCEANVELVLRCSAEWRGALWFDEVSKQLQVSGGPLPSDTRLEALDSEIAVWFQRSDYGRLGLMPQSRSVRETIAQVAFRNARDPLKEWLESLKWDGTPRIDTFLERYYGATGNERFLRAVSSKWLISAAARGLDPGCKVDTMLVIRGIQGAGKSSSFRALGGQWFADGRMEIGSTDADIKAGQFWIIESGEFKDIKRADIETIKDFLSKQDGTYRVLFKQVFARTPRRCVYVGSTNELNILKHDPSGYRRFWMVQCSRVDLAAILADRDQLMAEAVARYKAGIAARTPCLWWLDEEEGELAEAIAKEFVEVIGEASQEMVTEWLCRMAPERRPRKVTLRQVLLEAMQLEPSQITPAKEREATAVLNALGFERGWRDTKAGKGRCWNVPEALVSEPQMLPLVSATAKSA